MVTLQQWLAHTKQQLTSLDAEIIACEVLQQPLSFLYSHPEQALTTTQLSRCEQLSKRRIAGEPVAYITGHKEFWSLDLMVNPSVLIPRPETELLIEVTLDTLPVNKELHIVDLGTGSGAIALALAAERACWQLYATDQSPEALTLAKANATRLKIDNIVFFQGDWFAALPRDIQFDAIVSNPPYVALNDPHLASLCFEPVAALTAGPDGLEAIRQISAHASSYLTVNGWLLLEHGYDQRQAMTALFQTAGFDPICSYKDLAGKERVMKGQSRGKI